MVIQVAPTAILAQASMSGNPLLGLLYLLVIVVLGIAGLVCLVVSYLTTETPIVTTKRWLGVVGLLLAAPLILGLIESVIGGNQSPEITMAARRKAASGAMLMGAIAVILFFLKRNLNRFVAANPDPLWESDGSLLAGLLAKALDEQPHRFRFSAGDDEAQVEGLAMYFGPEKPWSFRFNPETNQIISVLGGIVVIVVDRDGDGTISARGITHSYALNYPGTFPCSLLRLEHNGQFWLQEPGWAHGGGSS